MGSIYGLLCKDYAFIKDKKASHKRLALYKLFF